MSPVGLTYATGRGSTRTTEANDPEDRVAGQFTSYLSCEVRSSASSRLRITRPTGLSSVSGGVVIYFDPDNAHDGGSQPANGHIFSYGVYADGALIRAAYDKGNARWYVQILDPSAGGAFLLLDDTWSAGAAKCLYVAWDTTTAYVAVDGGAVTSGGRGYAAWAAEYDTYDVGAGEGGALTFECAVGAVCELSGPLTSDQWEILAGLRGDRPPCPGEGGTSDVMIGLWIGESRVVWTYDALVDLNDLRGAEIMLSRLAGAGLAPLRHRAVVPPLRDGAVYVDTKLATRKLQAVMLLVSRSTFARLWQLRREIVSKTNPNRGQAVLTYAPSSILYEIDALPDSQGIALDESLGEFNLEPRVPFVCFDPRWRRVVLDETLIESLGSGLSVPVSVPVSMQQGSTSTIDNVGDVVTYPVVVVTGDVTNPRIDNLTTGKHFELEVQIPVGMTATIDMEARTATRSDGLNLMPYRTSTSEMWALERGDNEIAASWTTAASRPVDFSIRRQARYVGV